MRFVCLVGVQKPEHMDSDAMVVDSDALNKTNVDDLSQYKLDEYDDDTKSSSMRTFCLCTFCRSTSFQVLAYLAISRDSPTTKTMKKTHILP